MLIDTHIFIWATERRAGRMGSKTWQQVQQDVDNLMLSAVNFFEIRQKQRRGKLKHIDTEQALQVFRSQGVTVLDVSPEHTLCTPTADLFSHSDPFDLLLIAQAIREDLPLLTCDAKIIEAQIPGLRVIDGRL